MSKTEVKSAELTEAARGKHHIGDFLPPEELNKFLNKYRAIKSGETLDESDYQENRLTGDNMGFKMLQKMGWSEGAGLGSDGQGITAPINQSVNHSHSTGECAILLVFSSRGNKSDDKTGLGIKDNTHDLERDDDEFDAYRKRMMLAYRFRPNPMVSRLNLPEKKILVLV